MINLNIILQAAKGGGTGSFMIMMGGMLVVMYFFMIRPQMKKAKDHKKFVEELKKGDKVITTSGIHGKIVEMNVGTANNLTVPLNSSVAFPTGTEIIISQYGAGQTTIVATGGVTLRSKSGQLKIGNQYNLIRLQLWHLYRIPKFCFGCLTNF